LVCPDQHPKATTSQYNCYNTNLNDLRQIRVAANDDVRIGALSARAAPWRPYDKTGLDRARHASTLYQAALCASCCDYRIYGLSVEFEVPVKKIGLAEAHEEMRPLIDEEIEESCDCYDTEDFKIALKVLVEKKTPSFFGTLSGVKLSVYEY
jgi:hypothetical protein